MSKMPLMFAPGESVDRGTTRKRCTSQELLSSLLFRSNVDGAAARLHPEPRRSVRGAVVADLANLRRRDISQCAQITVLLTVDEYSREVIGAAINGTSSVRLQIHRAKC